jgi:hypothetical protein
VVVIIAYGVCRREPCKRADRRHADPAERAKTPLFSRAAVNRDTLGQTNGAMHMGKQRKSNKENKKKALLTPKEKKAAKKSKHAAKTGLAVDRAR